MAGSNIYHTNLANYFKKQSLFFDDEKEKQPNIRKCAELPWQQLTGRMNSDIVDTLTDLEFLEAKVYCGMMLQLIEEYTDALKCFHIEKDNFVILSVIQAALLRDIKFIMEYPNSLFQCLRNSCWWFDSEITNTNYKAQKKKSKGTEKDTPHVTPNSQVFQLMDVWEKRKESSNPDHIWIRSLRPPPIPIGVSSDLVLLGHNTVINEIVFSSNNRRIASCGSASSSMLFEGNFTAKIWDTDIGTELHSFDHHSGVRSVAFLMNDSLLVTASNDGHIKVFRNGDSSDVFLKRVSYSFVCSLQLSSNGEQLAGASGDGFIHIWNTTTWETIYKKYLNNTRITSVKFTKSGEIIYVTNYRKINIWDPSIDICKELVEVESDILVISESGLDSNYLIILKSGQFIRFCVNQQKLISLQLNYNSICRATFSPCLKLFAVGNYKGDIHILDVNSLREIDFYKAHNDSVSALTFSPDSTILASGSWDETVRLHKVNSPISDDCWHLPQHSENIAMISLSPNGLQVMSATFTGEVMIWDIFSGLFIEKMEGNILSNSLNLREKSWEVVQNVDSLIFHHKNLPSRLIPYHRRFDIIIHHPFGNLFIGAQGKNIFIVVIEGEKAKQASHLNQIDFYKINLTISQLKKQLNNINPNEDLEPYFKICEKLIHYYLILNQLKPVGNILEMIGDIMVSQRDNANASFFYAQAVQIWVKENDDKMVNKLSLKQQELK